MSAISVVLPDGSSRELESGATVLDLAASIGPRLADAALATTGPQYFDDHDAEHFMALAAKTAHKRLIFGGDCYNYGLLASGHVDLVVEAGLKLHDFAALVPVVEGAGGTMCDWNGDPLNADSAGHVIALGDPARLEAVIEGLACAH